MIRAGGSIGVIFLSTIFWNYFKLAGWRPTWKNSVLSLLVVNDSPLNRRSGTYKSKDAEKLEIWRAHVWLFRPKAWSSTNAGLWPAVSCDVVPCCFFCGIQQCMVVPLLSCTSWLWRPTNLKYLATHWWKRFVGLKPNRSPMVEAKFPPTVSLLMNNLFQSCYPQGAPD